MWSDEELVSAVAIRNHEAFSVLYDRYATLVYSIILRITRSRSEAADLVQALFVRLPDEIKNYNVACHCLDAWMLLSARKLAIDHIRSKRSDQKAPSSSQDILGMVFFEGRSAKEIASLLNTSPQTVHLQIRAAITNASPLLCR